MIEVLIAELRDEGRPLTIAAADEIERLRTIIEDQQSEIKQLMADDHWQVAKRQEMQYQIDELRDELKECRRRVDYY